MISTYSSFAVAGTGGLGSFIIKALASTPGISVVVLSRSASVVVPANATLRIVDYSSPLSLTTALAGSQVVISTLNREGIACQYPLADAARVVGVQLFVPSDFGSPTENVIDGPLFPKEEVATYLEKIGLSSLRVFTGAFSDQLFYPFAGFDFPNGKARWVGEGDTPISFTSRTDVAKFLAYTLTTLAPAKISGKIFRLQGDTKSLNQVVQIYEKTHQGKKVDVTRISVEDAKHTIENDKTTLSFMYWLLLQWESGCSVEKSGPLSHNLYPVWNPVTVQNILATYD
ncbi:hypothetical protein P7C70_g3731, partial [Phenoliferia sp. Uapishka_3]